MSKKTGTPFESIEGALEYSGMLLEAAREAQREVEAEIALATDPRLARRKEALQLANYKLATLSSHVAVTKKILNDLRMLRRLLLDERKSPRPAKTTESKAQSG